LETDQPLVLAISRADGIVASLNLSQKIVGDTELNPIQKHGETEFMPLL
jgi:hypothetical protein